MGETLLNNTNEQPKVKKCYNTFSCIMSVLVIIFIVGAILWDMFISKPMIYNSIEDIKTEMRIINDKIDSHYNFVEDMDSIAKFATDSVEIIK